MAGVPDDRKALLAGFIRALLRVYIDLHFVYLEINPLVVTGGQVLPLPVIVAHPPVCVAVVLLFRADACDCAVPLLL